MIVFVDKLNFDSYCNCIYRSANVNYGIRLMKNHDVLQHIARQEEREHMHAKYTKVIRISI